MVFLKEFFEKIDVEKKSADDKKHEKIPGGKEFIYFYSRKEIYWKK